MKKISKNHMAEEPRFVARCENCGLSMGIELGSGDGDLLCCGEVMSFEVPTEVASLAPESRCFIDKEGLSIREAQSCTARGHAGSRYWVYNYFCFTGNREVDRCKNS